MLVSGELLPMRLVKMDDEKVWAWLGSIDDIISHVAIRATLKLEIPM